MPTQPQSAKEYADADRLDLPSASALEIAVNCAGQPALKRSLPPEALQSYSEVEDEWAQRGTRIHAAFESGNTLELNAEELLIYEQGVRFNDMIVENWAHSKGITTYKEGPREVRVFLLDPVTLAPIGSAKPDRHYIAPPHLLVVDLKSGWNPNLAPSPRSWQLKFQGIALWKEEYGEAGIEEMRVAYCKPQSKYGASDVCDYTRQDMDYSLQSIRYHLWETAQPNAPRHAGHWCNWCPCKGFCPEAGAYSMLPSVIGTQAASIDMMNLEATVARLGNDDMLRIMEMAPAVGKIIAAVKARLKSLPAKELAALGLMLPEKGRKIDTISDVTGAFHVLSQVFSVDDIFKCLEFKKVPLVDMVQREKGMPKGAAETWLNTTLEKLITTTHAEASLRKLKD